MKELIGKKISKVSVNNDQSLIVFGHPDGSKTMYKTYSECCSETWFADITGFENLIGCLVETVEKVELSSVVDGRCRQEYDDFYGVKLKTNKGYADIIFRNSSNGYYGGDIKYIESKNTYDNLVEINSDWSA